MTMLDAALTVVAARMPGFDDDRREELLHSTRELAAERGRLGRVAEVGVLAGLVLRLRARRTSHVVLRGLVLGMALVLVAVTTTDARLVWAVLVPGALLALGWFDPRYATAAAVIWLWRFVTADPGATPDATVTFLRLVAMAAGVFSAFFVARLSLRRLRA